MYVDSDDFIAKNTLEGLFSFAENHDADVVIFDYIRGTTDIKNVQRQHYKIITDKYDGIPFNIETAESFVYRYVPVGVWVKFYLTDLIKDLKFERGMNNEDVPYWDLVYTRAKKVYYFPKPYYYTISRESAITQIKGKKIFDVFKAFSLSEKILKEAGYFEKFKSIHYAHFTCNLVNRMRIIIPELKQEFVETIKNYNIDIDYDKFDKEDFYQFEKDNMKLIKFIKENSFEATDKVMRKNNLWK